MVAENSRRPATTISRTVSSIGKTAAVLAQGFGLYPLAEYSRLAAGDIGGKAVPVGVA
jgi:hypothetical protein